MPNSSLHQLNSTESAAAEDKTKLGEELGQRSHNSL